MTSFNSLTSWVYLFSKFTPELLLFEALLLFLLGTTYAAFYVDRRKRLAAAEEDAAIPSSVIKTYLNEVILDAETLRSQLFGLLNSAGIPTNSQNLSATVAAHSAQINAADPQLVQKIAMLEAKMLEQSKSMESALLEKQKMEKELTTLRTAPQKAEPAAGASTAGSANDSAELLRKIQLLEARLGEYSIIEDDLANLKKLQHENNQLRNALVAKGGDPGKVASSSIPLKETAPSPATPAPVATSAPVATPAPAATPAAAVAETVAAVAAVTAAPATTQATPESTPAAFESMVDQLEEKMQETLSPAAPAATAAEGDSTATPESAGKSDADLLAEFEKMLNS